MKDITKHYTNGEVTIVWKPTACIHSTLCWKGSDALRDVFNPAEKPWIKPGGAATERIIQQIKKCPSGALSYYMNEEEKNKEEAGDKSVVEVMPGGPLLVHGNIIVKAGDGSEHHKHHVTAFCRCGSSSNKPYCDGTHTKIEFKD